MPVKPTPALLLTLLMFIAGCGSNETDTETDIGTDTYHSQEMLWRGQMYLA